MTVIIPSWQTHDYLMGCLDSLEATPHCRVVVVDGASTDGSADAAATRLPAADVIRLPENRGFAYAVNTGLRHALADTSASGPLILLNTDTVVAPHALQLLTEYLNTHARVAAVAPQLLLQNGTPQPFGFGGDPTPAYLFRRGWQKLVHKRPLHHWGDEAIVDVDWVSFACVAIRRQALTETGLLDESYYMYFEDTDWCLRARRLGWRITRYPMATVTHFGGAALKQNPRAIKAYRNSLRRFYRTHYSPLSRLALALMLPLYSRLA
ncbi:MAG: glycosyltransferase family 2 protein [Lentisphaerae bacterium]|jgi:GT2 family glycosyltransferase|nr:glycosyltransferase family 2 protein [Lentisphaerota bacterium]